MDASNCLLRLLPYYPHTFILLHFFLFEISIFIILVRSETYSRNVPFTVPQGNPSPGTLGGTGGSVGAGELLGHLNN